MSRVAEAGYYRTGVGPRECRYAMPLAEAEEIAAADDARHAVVAAEARKADDNG